jgi:hypothetical protein
VMTHEVSELLKSCSFGQVHEMAQNKDFSRLKGRSMDMKSAPPQWLGLGVLVIYLAQLNTPSEPLADMPD